MTDENTHLGIEKLTVIYVDDTGALLSTVKRSVRGTSYKFYAYEDPIKALEEIETMQDVALVISDFKMPGMNGDKLLMRIAELHPSTIRILSSADTKNLMQAQQQGVAHKYVEKGEFVTNARELIYKAVLEYLK